MCSGVHRFSKKGVDSYYHQRYYTVCLFDMEGGKTPPYMSNKPVEKKIKGRRCSAHYSPLYIRYCQYDNSSQVYVVAKFSFAKWFAGQVGQLYIDCIHYITLYNILKGKKMQYSFTKCESNLLK